MSSNDSIRRLFLIDGIGAIVTALLLSQVLARYESVFGMPAQLLYILAGIAACFALYSLTCFWRVQDGGAPFLKAIAIANTLYCVATLGIVSYHFDTLTWLGLNEKIEEMKKELPLGYSIERRQLSWGSQPEKQYALLGLIIVLIFFICALTFESLQQALAIIFIISTSFIGIFLTFYWFKFPFDQGGYTSFLLTSGLVVNGLILLVNDFNGFRKKYPGSSPLRPYLKALQHKIVPILLTIFSTSLGLVPFLMHGQQEVFWFSLAVGTIGGLLFSVVVLLLFTPLFFLQKSRPA